MSVGCVEQGDRSGPLLSGGGREAGRVCMEQGGQKRAAFIRRG